MRLRQRHSALEAVNAKPRPLRWTSEGPQYLRRISLPRSEHIPCHSTLTRRCSCDEWVLGWPWRRIRPSTSIFRQRLFPRPAFLHHHLYQLCSIGPLTPVQWQLRSTEESSLHHHLGQIHGSIRLIMHQHSRTPPKSASSASSPQADPSRPSDSRDGGARERMRPVSSGGGEGENSDHGSIEARESVPTGKANPAASKSGREGVVKLNQIIQVRSLLVSISVLYVPRAKSLTLRLQNYFVKAALIIAEARIICPPSYNKGSSTKRVNKWVST